MLNANGLAAFQLPARRVIRTSNLRRLREVVSREAEPIRYFPSERRCPGFVEITKLELSNTKLFGLSFDTVLSGEVAPTRNLEFYFIGSGSLKVTNCNSECNIGAGEGLVYFPGDYAVHHWVPGSRALALFIGRRRLEPLIHDFFRFDVRPFSTQITPLSFTSGVYRTIFSLIMQVSLETDRGISNCRGIDTGLEDLLHYACALIVDKLLDRRFATLTCEPAPKYLRHAVGYVLNNLDKDVTLADLGKTCRVSTRTLQYAFSKHFGKGPSAFMHYARLCKAREDLQKSCRNDTTVTDVAVKWGFCHASDFARQYTSLFGEYPSVTLRRPAPDRVHRSV